METLYNFVKLLLLQCHMLETALLNVFFFLFTLGPLQGSAKGCEAHLLTE